MRELVLGVLVSVAGYTVYRLGYAAGTRAGFFRSAEFLRALREPPNHRLINPTRWKEDVDATALHNAAPTNGGGHGDSD